MTGLPIVTRRDQLGELCFLCEGGRYIDYWSLLGDDRVVCEKCLAIVDRWLTKREVLEVITQHSDEDIYEDSK